MALSDAKSAPKFPVPGYVSPWAGQSLLLSQHLALNSAFKRGDSRFIARHLERLPQDAAVGLALAHLVLHPRRRASPATLQLAKYAFGHYLDERAKGTRKRGLPKAIVGMLCKDHKAGDRIAWEAWRIASELLAKCGKL